MQEPEKVSKMDALLFVINLEVAYLQMQLIESCAKHYELGYVPRNKNESLRRIKLTKERYFVKDILKRTLVELVNCNEYPTLQESVNVLKNNNLYLSQLRKTNDDLRTSMGDIKSKLTKSRQESAFKINDCDRSIAIIKDKIKDTILNTNMQLKYVDKWLSARVESLDLEFQREEKPAPRIDFEKRVHEQVVNFYDIQIKEREESLQYWKLRYQKDIVDITERLKEQREKYKATVDRRIELQKLYDLHAGEMRGWLTFKQERAARLAREERSRVSATRIQAWWRGVMVRRCIGVFKQLKNKKQPAKSKKK